MASALVEATKEIHRARLMDSGADSPALAPAASWSEATKAIKCDWFSFTTRRKLSQVLPLFDFLPLPLVPKQSGLYGYKLSFVSPSGVSVLFSPDRDDVHVQVSGTGVDCCSDFYHLISLVDADGGDSISRVDIALDCMGSGVTCSDIWGLLQQGSFSACSSQIRQFEGLVRVDQRAKRANKRNDHTIYIGSVSSERMVRIYDKGAESKTNVDWLRFEVQLRGASAKRFFVLAMRGTLGEFESKGVQLLNKQIRLLDKKAVNGELAREVMNPFWAWLTDSAVPLTLVIPKSAKKICNTMRYIKNASAAIKALSIGLPDCAEWLASNVDTVSLKTSHRQLINEMLGAVVDWEDFCVLIDGEVVNHVATGEIAEEFSKRDLDYMEIFPILNDCRLTYAQAYESYHGHISQAAA